MPRKLLTDEERAARIAAREATYQAKRAAKEVKKAANRKAWASDTRNANFQREQTLEAVVPGIVEPVLSDTGSLGKLRAIMADTTTPLYRRLDAAEVVLAYELAPASLAQAPDEQVAATSFRFLQAVADATETPEALRFRALKCIAAIENARASRVTVMQQAEQRDLTVHRINAARRLALSEAGTWEMVVRDRQRWALRVEDEFDMPAQPVSGLRRSPNDGIGNMLDRARALPIAEQERQYAERRAALLAVKAKNRPDDWERLLEPKAASDHSG